MSLSIQIFSDAFVSGEEVDNAPAAVRDDGPPTPTMDDNDDNNIVTVTKQVAAPDINGDTAAQQLEDGEIE